jgi:hypothetical protein
VTSDNRTKQGSEGDTASPNSEEIELVAHSQEDASARTLAIKLAGIIQQLTGHHHNQGQVDVGQDAPVNADNTEVQERLPTVWQDLVSGGGLPTMPPDQVGWFDLADLAERDPEAAARCWQALYQAAYDELIGGHRAAAAVGAKEETPWQRARFLALRASLAHEWEPRTGIEWHLVDLLAQAAALQEQWLKRLIAATETQDKYAGSQYSGRGRKEPARLSDAQMVQQAGEMVDRFSRVYLRTLRQLRDLRRYTPALRIETAHQVNVSSEQQINVVGDGR